ncbi:MAG TPA: FprA family A-type flavoprotein [Candidatus Aquicultor sp.]|jgi:flavorubredoxin
MGAVELKDGVYWVGALDWSIRDFHGYETPRGTSYNNYLIMDEEITLIDTVKYTFAKETITHIKRIVDPVKIKHLVINHIENDHVTSIDKILEIAPTATVYMTEKGKNGLARFFDISKWNIKTVKTGDTLAIGKRTLLFMETPMLHWPDSMMTYIKEDKILFSQDGFGQHIASAARFDDEYIESESEADLEDAIVDYYSNILMPFGQLIKNKIAEIQKLELEIDMIAPDHGVIWRQGPDKILQRYLGLATGKADLRVAIIYDTMWQSTELMIEPISQGIMDEGVDCKVIKLRATAMSVAIKELYKSRGFLIGTPTLNNLMFPTLSAFLTYLRGLRPKNRIAGAFGSYGWGKGGVKGVYEEIDKIGLEKFEPGMEVQFRPQAEDHEQVYNWGREFAQKVKEYHQNF